MTGKNSEKRLSKLSELIEARLGLHFPKDRLRYLQQGIDSAAAELGFKDSESCTEWLLSASWTKTQIEILASYLTVGETYFFRDLPTFEALEKHVLEKLIHERRKNGKYLRIWSAGCSSGEEPYSIAILLSKLIPDLSEWNVTILGTDINPLFLKKAIGGIYSQWSFRNLPEGLMKGFFKKTEANGFKIVSSITRMVTFSYLNLVEDNFPSLVNNTNAMDIIFCRNVLMYFAPHVAAKVIRGLRNALVDGGYLVVSPSESFSLLSSQFSAARFSAGNVYKKDRTGSLEPGKSESKSPPPPYKGMFFSETSETTRHSDEGRNPGEALLDAGFYRHDEKKTTLVGGKEGIFDHTPTPEPHSESIISKPDDTPEQYQLEQALALYAAGSYKEAEEGALRLLARNPAEAGAMILLARIYANRGELEPALEWCRKAIEYEKLSPGYYYLLATILQELGRTEDAIPVLKRALYLEPNFILAHLALGNISRKFGRQKEAAKYFRNALSLLSSKNPEEMVPESEGINAARLIDVIQSMGIEELTVH